MIHPIRIGTAGWSIPRGDAEHFPVSGSHLERYGRVFNTAEINSSFYRPHRNATYQRWAASVPPSFRFAVKMPKPISHERRLQGCEALLTQFLEQAEGLGDKLGALLLQLPPSLALHTPTVQAFLKTLRGLHAGAILCEPRHASWFVPEGDALLAAFTVDRVAADPPPAPMAAQPGGWCGPAYFRLHGAPRIYHSPYGDDALELLSRRVTELSRQMPVWCIFDNTASFAATRNALALQRMLAAGSSGVKAL